MPDRIELPPSPDSAATARAWAADVLRPDAPELADTVALLVSELVTNVVLHARTPCQLSVDVSGPRIRVEVRDGSGTLPGRTLRKEPFALSGRGMLLVDGLSAAHGAEALSGGGKLVWFEVEKGSAPA